MDSGGISRQSIQYTSAETTVTYGRVQAMKKALEGIATQGKMVSGSNSKPVAPAVPVRGKGAYLKTDGHTPPTPPRTSPDQQLSLSRVGKEFPERLGKNFPTPTPSSVRPPQQGEVKPTLLLQKPLTSPTALPSRQAASELGGPPRRPPPPVPSPKTTQAQPQGAPRTTASQPPRPPSMTTEEFKNKTLEEMKTSSEQYKSYTTFLAGLYGELAAKNPKDQALKDLAGGMNASVRAYEKLSASIWQESENRYESFADGFKENMGALTTALLPIAINQDKVKFDRLVPLLNKRIGNNEKELKKIERQIRKSKDKNLESLENRKKELNANIAEAKLCLSDIKTYLDPARFIQTPLKNALLLKQLENYEAPNSPQGRSLLSRAKSSVEDAFVTMNEKKALNDALNEAKKALPDLVKTSKITSKSKLEERNQRLLENFDHLALLCANGDKDAQSILKKHAAIFKLEERQKNIKEEFDQNFQKIKQAKANGSDLVSLLREQETIVKKALQLNSVLTPLNKKWDFMQDVRLLEAMVKKPSA
jgi:hypothetical protein